MGGFWHRKESMERGEYQHPRRGKQPILFSGFTDGTITPTDLDALWDYNGKGWIIAEAKYNGKEVDTGQRIAFENWVKTCRAAGVRCLVIIVDHYVSNPDEGVILRDGWVRKMYSTETMDWTYPQQPITAKEVVDRYKKKFKLRGKYEA